MESSKKRRTTLTVCIAVLAALGVAGLGFILDGTLRKSVILESYSVKTLPMVELENEDGYMGYRSSAGITIEGGDLTVEDVEGGLAEGTVWEYLTREGELFQLNYITNLYDPRKVVSISFKEAPELKFRATEETTGRGWTSYDHGQAIQEKGFEVGSYALRTIYVSLETAQLLDLIQQGKSLELSNATIGFSADNEHMEHREVFVGKILLQPERQRSSDERTDTAMNVESGSQSRGTSTQTFRVSKDLEIVSVQSPVLDEADKVMEITVNGTDYKDAKGLRLEANGPCDVAVSPREHPEVRAKYNRYEPLPVITCKDSAGNIYDVPCSDVQYLPESAGNLRFWKMRGYLKERGAI